MKAGAADDGRRGFLGFTVGASFRVGVEFSRVHIRGRPYLDRWILYCGGTLRLHRFWRGDDDRASHTHPWWFWTFPFSSYGETVFVGGVAKELRTVRALRLHKRAADFEHVVQGRIDYPEKPFWTLVLTGRPRQQWGFYPAPNQFVPWKEWF